MAVEVPPVGVLAKTANIATSIAKELGLTNFFSMGLSTTSHRGRHLSCLLIDDSAWPLTPDQKREFLPMLAPTKGYVYKVKCLDPAESKNPYGMEGT